MAEKEIKLPLYRAGETHFLSHRTGMPARIYVEAVYMKANSKEWMYSIYSEANNCKQTYLPESILAQRVSKHNSPVYKKQEIIDRCREGYRFCGNFDADTAISRGEEFAKNNDITRPLSR